MLPSYVISSDLLPYRPVWSFCQYADWSYAFALLSQVWVNQYNLLNNNVPFGGKKQSGIGEYYSPGAYISYAAVGIWRTAGSPHRGRGER